jgi:hypothetical protein
MEAYLEVRLKLVFLHQASKFWSKGPYGGPHWSCSNPPTYETVCITP